ncbi:hypothetical protein MRS44_017871 [Fusarium solani]|uniref:uncharacterized protein n=1 Tax=Fusarium solani TaxID=169388 RepID=UPI0032C43242|nr:hypothetical protein MRS44_017871 [Fusarium solani]
MSLSKVARENDIAEVLIRNENGEPLRPLARQYHLHEGMLRGREKGSRDARTAQIRTQKLSPLQEKVLANYLLEEEAAGRGLSRRDIREIAQEIYDPESEDITIGKTWPDRFLERNPDIKLKPSTPIEAARAKEAAPERIQCFSSDLEREIEEKNVPPDPIYNVDEHGLTEGKTKAGKVFGDALTRRSFVSQSDNRTWVSVLETANAVGRRTKPRGFCRKRSHHEPIPGGFWSSMDFMVIFLLDSDSELHFIEFSLSTYPPPHSSHITQPLDVSVFGPLKRAFEDLMRKCASFTTASPIAKQRFIEAYKIASEKAITEKNIRHGFLAAGIWPIDVEKPLSQALTTEQEAKPKTPPRTPKRRRTRRDSILNTPKNKAELQAQLLSLQKDPENFEHKANLIAERTGNSYEFLKAEAAEWKAKFTYLQAQQESQKSTKKKAIDYDPIGRFPTEEIQGQKEKTKKRKRRRRGNAQPTTEQTVEEIGNFVMNNMMSQFQA